jgi:rsbT co-antagonist protein RsbR
MVTKEELQKKIEELEAKCKQEEKSRRDTQKMFQLVMDNIPQAIFWKDTESVLLGCNQNFAQVAGVKSPADIVGKTDYDLAWKKEEADAFRVDDREVMDSDTPKLNIIEPQLQASGKQVWLETNKVPLHNDEGNVIGVVGSFADITERIKVEKERERLQQEVIDAQRRAIQELSTPVIPIMDRIIVMPMVGSIDSMRARDITRSLLAGIGKHRAKFVILDVTGVSLMDTGIVNHLNKTIQAARLKGAETIVTGISDAVAESIVDLGIDWSAITTLSDLQSGLMLALNQLGFELNRT